MTVINQNGFKPIYSNDSTYVNSPYFHFNLPDEAQEATLKIRINYTNTPYRPGALFMRCRDALHDGTSFQGNIFQFDYQTNVYYKSGSSWTDGGTVTNQNYIYIINYYNTNQTDRCAAVIDITLKNYATDDRLYNSIFVNSDWTNDTGGSSVFANRQFSSGYAYSSVGANTIRNIQLLTSNAARIGHLNIKVWADTEVSDG